MLRVLVLGGEGQLGRELTALCVAKGIDVRSLGRQACDISNEPQVCAILAADQPSVVINAAAYTKVDQAETEQSLAFRFNCEGPGIVARSCASRHIPLIHVSTDYVFDGAKNSPYTEADPVAPLGAYGRSKEAGEQAIRNALEQHVIVRTSWVYGSHGTNFLKTMLNLASTRDSWGVVGDQIGTPTATIDLAEALLAVARRTLRYDTPWGTFHFSGQGDATWFEFAEEIVAAQMRYTGKTPTLKRISTEEYPTPTRRPKNSRMNSDRFDSTFGVRARPWRERTRAVVDLLLGKAG